MFCIFFETKKLQIVKAKLVQGIGGLRPQVVAIRNVINGQLQMIYISVARS